MPVKPLLMYALPAAFWIVAVSVSYGPALDISAEIESLLRVIARGTQILGSAAAAKLIFESLPLAVSVPAFAVRRTACALLLLSLAATTPETANWLVGLTKVVSAN